MNGDEVPKMCVFLCFASAMLQGIHAYGHYIHIHTRTHSLMIVKRSSSKKNSFLLYTYTLLSFYSHPPLVLSTFNATSTFLSLLLLHLSTTKCLSTVDYFCNYTPFRVIRNLLANKIIVIRIWWMAGLVNIYVHIEKVNKSAKSMFFCERNYVFSYLYLFETFRRLC